MVKKLSLNVTDIKRDINEEKQNTQDMYTHIQQIKDGNREYYNYN